MPHEELQQRPFRRTFAWLAGAFFIAVVVLAIGAAIGVAAPGLLAWNAAVLLTGGGLALVAITVPVALYAMHRYARAAAENVESLHMEAHGELHAAHDSILEHAKRAEKSNESMHKSDRDAIRSLGHRIDDQAIDIEGRASRSAIVDLQRTTQAKHEEIETAQERQWVGHVHSHTEAERASEEQWTALDKVINDLTARIKGLEAAGADVDRRFKSHATKADRRTQEAEDATKALRLSLHETRSELESRLAEWQAPESQLKQWAARINDHADHELARFRHKLQHQLNQFEAREAEDRSAATRQGLEQAAMLAEDILHDRLIAMEADHVERMQVFKRSVDEQFALFLAGQQAQQLEYEARLAAVGASRGIKVQASQAYSLTTHAPFGRVHPIADVEGIGNKTAYTLQGMGILDTEHFWHADVPELAKKLGITTRQVRQWQSQAELMAIDGIGPQWGEALASSGITGIGHLANLHGRELMELLRAHGHAQRSKLHKGVINLAKAEDFIQRAREHRPEQAIYV